MAYKTKLRKIGNSLGIVIPKGALQSMKVAEGDTLYITEAPEGAVQLQVSSPDFEEKARIADSLMKRYRNALRELAK